MEFIVDNFWKTLFLIGIGVVGWFGYEKWQKTQAWNTLGESYEASYRAIKCTPNASAESCYGNYWRFLALLKQAQLDIVEGKVIPVMPKDREGVDEINPDSAMRWLLDASIKSAGSSAAQPLIKELLLTNLTLCEKYGIFTRESNLEKMADGRAPVIPSGPYEGDKLILVPRLPIELVPGATRHLANLTLVPESVAGIISPDIDENTYQFASRLKSAQALDTAEFNTIAKLYESGRK